MHACKGVGLRDKVASTLPLGDGKNFTAVYYLIHIQVCMYSRQHIIGGFKDTLFLASLSVEQVLTFKTSQNVMSEV